MQILPCTASIKNQNKMTWMSLLTCKLQKHFHRTMNLQESLLWPNLLYYF